jgi:hypothetical protein
MSKLKQFWKTLCAIARGIKKTFDAAVNVGEAIAWGGLLATSYTVIYQAFQGNIGLNDMQLYGVVFSAIGITLRVLVEGKNYFERIGSVEEK